MGKSGDAVVPVTTGFPCGSSARSMAESSFTPPRKVEKSRVLPLGLNLLTNTSRNPLCCGPTALRVGKSGENVVPATLTAMGVERGRIPELAAMAIVDPTAGGNPVELTKENTERLYEDAM